MVPVFGCGSLVRETIRRAYGPWRVRPGLARERKARFLCAYWDVAGLNESKAICFGPYIVSREAQC
jgi:hypothetical protein